MQVLLVDDSQSSLAYLANLLSPLGDVSVSAFLDPAQALARAHDERFDLVIVDHVMPGMDGITFISRLSRTPFHKQTPKIMLTASEESEVKLSALEAGATDFLNKSIPPAELCVRLRNAVELARALRNLIEDVEGQAVEIRAAAKKLLMLEEEMVFRLSKALEYRDNETHDHTYRVAVYSRLIGERLGLSDDMCRSLFLASPLHDIGKVAIPDGILLKPGLLDENERNVIKKHAEVGGQILAGSPSALIAVAAVIAEAHHERWDGSGYPKGLSGEDIPLAARIVAVADVFDALTTARPYKAAMSVEKALAVLRSERGRHFDPACLDAFVEAVTEMSGTPACLNTFRETIGARQAGRALRDRQSRTRSAC